MNKFFKQIFVIGLIVAFGQLKAQECGTDNAILEQLIQDPAMKAKIDKFYAQAQNNPNMSKATKIIIPVVVHVIHSNGIGNISLAQIQSGIDVLNTDFNKLNADTSQIRPIFAGLADAADIEFRLARKDPNGICTEGVNRVNSFLSYNSRDEVKALGQWDENKYFNVWLVNSISGGSGGGTVVGYGQFPFSTTSATLNTYGIVVRQDQWGTIGTAAGGDGRTVTHEIGHCFNLLHTFQSGCGSNCINSGDRICDTPPASNSTFGCNKTNNTCSNDATGSSSAFSTNVPDMLENFMSYDDCQFMFTQMQVNVIRSVLNNSSYPWLISLVSSSNLVATGTNDGYVPQNCNPIVHFETPNDIVYACVGDTVTLLDNFTYNGAVSSYNWSLVGATPATSSSANPQVVYNAAGVYDVKLTTSPGNSTQTAQRKIVITDGNSISYTGVSYVENFESPLRFFNEYTVEDPTGFSKWVQSNIAGYNSSSSARLNNNAKAGTIFTQANGEIESFVTPAIDMSNVVNPTMTFQIAYKKRSNSSSDYIEIFTSFDCGKTWNARWSFLNSAMMSVSSIGQQDFVPASASDWKQLTALFPGGVLNGQSNVKFKIKFISGEGNNCYIDDLTISGAVGLDENLAHKIGLSIYPNPTKDESVMQFNLEQASTVSIDVMDVSGRKVSQIANKTLNSGMHYLKINSEQLDAGIYFVQMNINGERAVKKLVVE